MGETKKHMPAQIFPWRCAKNSFNSFINKNSNYTGKNSSGKKRGKTLQLKKNSNSGNLPALFHFKKAKRLLIQQTTSCARLRGKQMKWILGKITTKGQLWPSNLEATYGDRLKGVWEGSEIYKRMREQRVREQNTRVHARQTGDNKYWKSIQNPCSKLVTARRVSQRKHADNCQGSIGLQLIAGLCGLFELWRKNRVGDGDGEKMSTLQTNTFFKNSIKKRGNALEKNTDKNTGACWIFLDFLLLLLSYNIFR